MSWEILEVPLEVQKIFRMWKKAVDSLLNTEYEYLNQVYYKRSSEDLQAIESRFAYNVTIESFLATGER